MGLISKFALWRQGDDLDATPFDGRFDLGRFPHDVVGTHVGEVDTPERGLAGAVGSWATAELNPVIAVGRQLVEGFIQRPAR